VRQVCDTDAAGKEPRGAPCRGDRQSSASVGNLATVQPPQLTYYCEVQTKTAQINVADLRDTSASKDAGKRGSGVCIYVVTCLFYVWDKASMLFQYRCLDPQRRLRSHFLWGQSCSPDPISFVCFSFRPTATGSPVGWAGSAEIRILKTSVPQICAACAVSCAASFSTTLAHPPANLENIFIQHVFFCF
jgi:hypothetical protein